MACSSLTAPAIFFRTIRRRRGSRAFTRRRSGIALLGGDGGPDAGCVLMGRLPCFEGGGLTRRAVLIGANGVVRKIAVQHLVLLLGILRFFLEALAVGPDVERFERSIGSLAGRPGAHVHAALASSLYLIPDVALLLVVRPVLVLHQFLAGEVALIGRVGPELGADQVAGVVAGPA